MIRRPPRSTQSRSSAASDVYKRQVSTQSTGRTSLNMKLVVTLALVVVAAATLEPIESIVPEVEVESDNVESDDVDSPYSLLQSKVEALGENQCTKMANDAKKAVLAAIRDEQSVLDLYAHAAGCSTKGDSAVTLAEKALTFANGQKTKYQKARDKARGAMVDFGSHKFSSLNKNNCNAFWNSNAFRSAEAAVNAANSKYGNAVQGVKDATSQLSAARKARTSAQQKCFCAAKTSYANKIKAANAKIASGQSASWKQAHLLLCVLSNTKESRCTIPKIPALVDNSKQVIKFSGQCHGHGTLFPHLNDQCNGKRIPKTCGRGNVMLFALKDYHWKKNQVYACPAGWYWVKATHWFNYLKADGCSQNNAKAGREGHAYYNQCGWSGYRPPGSSQNKERFRFADSAQNNEYQHAGTYIGYRGYATSSTSHFAGIACMRNGY
eukprot:TRINITY_DN2371_c0_g1_i1.p1 TRINITY_DN2371_c0_g1~~TRINITY_DN2371_c0_g1_i1.p1  ORF type:complete len:438 (-),score=171.30 TRINITY_DN2371_c0_g1_i1:227-1540(-)